MEGADDYDVEAAQLVAETAAAGRRVIVEHLEDHLLRNPNSTYEAWIAALHPDNVQVDQRLLQDGNEWLAVWNSSSGIDKARAKANDAHSSGSRSFVKATVNMLRSAAHVAAFCVLEAARSVCLQCSRLCHMMARRVPRMQKRSWHRGVRRQ
eukprot:TRINITY_DN84541_c0_g1_i1.p1 TRINITY_DN84541_c0_g1~~TRINITY_DN84541_c0_g1_i1.p1  ORF type:complete len:152 (+),score=29.40 TRINITY_DN84541_c0_g1_i1:93-548(+)